MLHWASVLARNFLSLCYFFLLENCCVEQDDAKRCDATQCSAGGGYGRALNSTGGGLGSLPQEIDMWIIVNRYHPICVHQKHIFRGKLCIFVIINSWDTEISIFGFSAVSFGKCARRGSASANFQLNITVFGSKNSEKYMFIHINMVGVNDGPAWLLVYAWIAYFPGFSRGATFRHIYVYISTTVPYISLNWMQIVRRQFSNSQ